MPRHGTPSAVLAGWVQITKLQSESIAWVHAAEAYLKQLEEYQVQYMAVCGAL
jgi:hypothetical protein